MFGYIVMNKPEIKFKDFDLYRSFYCGLCRELKSKYGISGQISLTYDMTFVALLRSIRQKCIFMQQAQLVNTL